MPTYKSSADQIGAAFMDWLNGTMNREDAINQMADALEGKIVEERKATYDEIRLKIKEPFKYRIDTPGLMIYPNIAGVMLFLDEAEKLSKDTHDLQTKIHIHWPDVDGEYRWRPIADLEVYRKGKI